MVVINQILVYCLNILSPFIEKVINQIVYSTSTGLLNLPPNSKDAQVFEQFAKQQAAAQSSPSEFCSSSYKL
jgi:preprotein translocase subunit SecB